MCIRDSTVATLKPGTFMYLILSRSVLVRMGLCTLSTLQFPGLSSSRLLKVQNPILTSTDLLKIKHMNVPGFKTATVSINYYKNTSLEKAIDRVFLEVDRAYKDRCV